jgi:hypothetical protein
MAGWAGRAGLPLLRATMGGAMTLNEFRLTLIGEGHYHTTDGKDRLRYIVAEAIYARAKELQKERPDIAGRLRYAAGEIEHGGRPSKKAASKLAREMKVIESRLVDGVSVSGR